MEEIIFKNIEELYERLKPALVTKEQELFKLGYKHLKKEDVWNYLQEAVWKKSNDLMLSDMVNDILLVKAEDINQSFLSKQENNQRNLNLEDIRLN